MQPNSRQIRALPPKPREMSEARPAWVTGATLVTKRMSNPNTALGSSHIPPPLATVPRSYAGVASQAKRPGEHSAPLEAAPPTSTSSGTSSIPEPAKVLKRGTRAAKKLPPITTGSEGEEVQAVTTEPPALRISKEVRDSDNKEESSSIIADDGRPSEDEAEGTGKPSGKSGEKFEDADSVGGEQEDFAIVEAPKSSNEASIPPASSPTSSPTATQPSPDSAPPSATPMAEHSALTSLALGAMRFFSPAAPARTTEEDEHKRRIRAMQRQRDAHIVDIANHNDTYTLAGEIVTRGETIERLKGVLEDKVRVGRDSEAREQALGRQVQEMEMKLEEVRKELSNSRAFVESEDAGDVEGVVNGLKDISAAIDDLAFQIIESLPDTLDTTPLDSGLCHAVESTFPPYSSLAKASHRFKSTCQDFLLHAVCSIMVMSIHREVFQPFKVGLDITTNKLLSNLYESIGKTETQDRAARWRSITYERCVPSSEQSDKLYCTTVTADILTILVSLISLLLPPSSDTPTVDLSKWAPSLLDITLTALAWRSKTRRQYLSYDYEPIVQPRDLHMRHELKKEDKGAVVAINSFGLRWRRSSKDGGGQDKIKVTEKWLQPVGIVWESDLNTGGDEEETSGEVGDEKME